LQRPIHNLALAFQASEFARLPDQVFVEVDISGEPPTASSTISMSFGLQA
jgi:hypothetical protein